MNSARAIDLRDLNFRLPQILATSGHTVPRTVAYVLRPKGLTEHSRLDSGPTLTLANLRPTLFPLKT